MTESNLGYTPTAPRNKGERGDLSYSKITKVFELDLGPSSKSQRHPKTAKRAIGHLFYVIWVYINYFAFTVHMIGTENNLYNVVHKPLHNATYKEIYIHMKYDHR